MSRQSLLVAALFAACFSLSAAHAAPAVGVALKASAGEGSAIQQVKYRHHHHMRHHGREACWWQDRELCRWFW